MTLVLDALSIRPPGGPPLFPALSLTVAAGEVATVMGPSGVGKSTLLDAIGGHLAHGFRLSGRIVLNGVDVTAVAAEKRQIGLMFQDAMLFPHLSLADNLAFGLRPGLRGRHQRAEAVESALAQAGLDGMGDRDPATLSGGQRARAALMRTLLAGPKAVLLDEPFSRLDADRRDRLRRFVFDHVRARGIPTLLVTHDAEDARAAGGTVVALAEGG